MLENLDFTINDLAEQLNIHPRTLRDWKRGKFTIPNDSFDALVKLAKIDVDILEVNTLPQWWHNKQAGQIGGRTYIAKYGSPGTLQSRKTGGYSSYSKRKNVVHDIYTRNHIIEPKDSENLAEFFGLMIGDGSIGPYQISISLNNKTDVEYAQYVQMLIKSLFGITPDCRRRESMNCIVIEVSSVNLVQYLINKGLPLGDKLRGGVKVPEWIKLNRQYSITCLRGMFDTDGSVFQEVHTIKGKKYSYCRMSFVSASTILLKDAYNILTSLGINAKIRGNRAVTIERFTDIQEYFRIVGSSNPKHNCRFASFGGVG